MAVRAVKLSSSPETRVAELGSMFQHSPARCGERLVAYWHGRLRELQGGVA